MPPVFAGWRNIFLRRPPGKYNTRSTPLASVQHQQTPPRAAPHPNPHPIPPNQPVRNHTPFYKQYNFWTTALAVFAILAALAFFLLQWLYQDWTAHKDFREYCQSEQDANKTSTASCDQALTVPLPPPPFSRIQVAKHSIRGIGSLKVLVRYNGRSQILVRVAIGIFLLALLVFVFARTNIQWSFLVTSTPSDEESVLGYQNRVFQGNTDSVTPVGRLASSPTQQNASIQDSSTSRASALDSGDHSGLRRRRDDVEIKWVPPVWENTSQQIERNHTSALEASKRSKLRRRPGFPEASEFSNTSLNKELKNNTPRQHDQPHHGLPLKQPRRGSTEMAELIKLPLATALKWREDTKKGLPTELPNPECLSKLKGKDYAFIVDDSESMLAHWKEVQSLFSILAYILNMVDDGGVDLRFSTSDKYYNSRRLAQLLQKRKPQGIGEIEKRLDGILWGYIARLRQDRVHQDQMDSSEHLESLHASREDIRPLVIYVLTDGLWAPNTDPASSIKNLVNELARLGLDTKLVRIQFISFGGDDIGLKQLGRLDKHSSRLKHPMYFASRNRKYLDIVHITPSTDDNLWKMLLGSAIDDHEWQASSHNGMDSGKGLETLEIDFGNKTTPI